MAPQSRSTTPTRWSVAARPTSRSTGETIRSPTPKCSPPPTERIDRTEKFDAYVQTPTLQEYVLIDQASRRVEVFPRNADWQREMLTSGDTLRLPSIDFEIPVDAPYRRVAFDT